MEHGEELMQLNRTAFERNTQAFERLMAAFDRIEKATDEQQVFIRDMNRRNEVVVQRLIRDHQEFMRGSRCETRRASARPTGSLPDWTTRGRNPGPTEKRCPP
jgi:hypothetical protein